MACMLWFARAFVPSILSSAKFRFPRTRRGTPPAPRMWTSLNTARRHHMFSIFDLTEI